MSQRRRGIRGASLKQVRRLIARASGVFGLRYWNEYAPGVAIGIPYYSDMYYDEQGRLRSTTVGEYMGISRGAFPERIGSKR